MKLREVFQSERKNKKEGKHRLPGFACFVGLNLAIPRFEEKNPPNCKQNLVITLRTKRVDSSPTPTQQLDRTTIPRIKNGPTWWQAGTWGDVPKDNRKP